MSEDITPLSERPSEALVRFVRAVLGDPLEGKKYLVLPGDVRSRTDGQIHYINATQLMRLYCVRREECIIFREGMTLDVTGLNPLQPRFDGKYPIFDELPIRGVLKEGCPNDTNGDGDCGRPMCPECGESGIRQRQPGDRER